MRRLGTSAAIGVGAAVLGILLFGRSPAGATVSGQSICAGEVEVVVTVNDCGDGLQDAVVLGRALLPCGAFALEVPTVGPGVGYVCGFQDSKAARWRGTDGVRLDLAGVVR